MTSGDSTGVTRISDGYWEHFRAPLPPPYRITGKYLFIAADRDLLVGIALEELSTGSFHHAKTHLAEVVPPSGEYVLCLYYADDSRKIELKQKYGRRPGLKYRFWKSNAATRARQYSEEFLSTLDPDERQAFLKKEPPEE